jgi:hypothetical protein
MLRTWRYRRTPYSYTPPASTSALTLLAAHWFIPGTASPSSLPSARSARGGSDSGWRLRGGECEPCRDGECFAVGASGVHDLTCLPFEAKEHWLLHWLWKRPPAETTLLR